MHQRFTELGGKVYTGKSVAKVQIKGKRATGIYLHDGTFIETDYVICACDTDHTFGDLLDKRYRNSKLSDAYKDQENYPVSSAFQIAFAVDVTFDEIPEAYLFPCEPITVATQTYDMLGVKITDPMALRLPHRERL